MKDRFSAQAATYASFRPTYPEALITYLSSLCSEHACAWDCGTGNGQLAEQLTLHFTAVKATDSSAQQLAHSRAHPRIEYLQAVAEEPVFQDAQFDLITVAQAVHWFDQERFFAEVRRTLKPAGVIALIGYYLPRISGATDAITDHIYTDTLGTYWDKERRLIDDHYRSLHFPFREKTTPTFRITTRWTVDHWIGYLNSWSATINFIRQNGFNPIEKAEPEMRKAWGTEAEKEVEFSIFMRVGTL